MLYRNVKEKSRKIESIICKKEGEEIFAGQVLLHCLKKYDLCIISCIRNCPHILLEMIQV